MAKTKTYYELLSEAIAHFDETGYSSAEDLAFWTQRLRDAAMRETVPHHVMEEQLRAVLSGTYKRMIDQGGILKYHPEVDRFTIQRVLPQLRAELDRRIYASADLIVLNKEKAVNDTIQRFQGWVTSVPEGGSAAMNKRETNKDIRKSLTRLPYEERRVLIDQGNKLISAVNDIVATGGGAIAAIWHSHSKQPNYNFRKAHAEREGKIYLIRNSWAVEKGLIKPGPAGWVDQITQPGEEVYCRCWFEYIYGLRKLPDQMLTNKGRVALAEARQKIKEMV